MDRISLVYQNVRGLNTKLSSLYVDSFNFHHHIIIFTETWLTDTVLNSEIMCDNFQIFRRDRGINKKAGGVLIAVSNIFQAESIVYDTSSNIEFLAVVIKLNNKNIFVSVSYIPPSSSFSIYTEHAQAIEFATRSVKTNDLFISVGDFNMPTVAWNYSDENSFWIPVLSLSNSTWEEFINSILDLALYQMNGILNHQNRLLDLMFINEFMDIAVERSTPIVIPEDLYHPTIELNLPVSFESNDETNSVNNVFCFKKTNYQLLNYFFNQTNWMELFSPTNITLDEIVKRFYARTSFLFDLCIPKQPIRMHSGPPWNTIYLSKLKNKKNKLYKKYKKSGSSCDYRKYVVAREKYNTFNRTCYANYLSRMRLDFSNNPRSFYRFVNSKRRSTVFPYSMKFQKTESCDDLDISNMFADFFSTTYSNAVYNDASFPVYSQATSQNICLPFFDAATIASNLKKLKFSYTSGPDNIPSCILINCADALAEPLAAIFNISIKNGEFPDLWKNSFITPLYKSGAKFDVTNYRGIAKLSVIPKLFEKLVTEFISHHASSLLHSAQHGFRKGCSTTTNLLQLTTTVNQGFLLRKQTDIIYTDFSKAFDKVNHNLLLKKLDLMGFSKKFLKWIGSYLLNRKQCVRFKSSLSKEFDVTSGVPQGSHLGPLLFTLFINDLPNVIKFCNILMYADDVKMFLTFDKYSDHTLLQNDLNLFYNWCTKNLMELNINKCKYITFYRGSYIDANYSLGNHQLERVLSMNDLGVLLDPKLSFNQHVSLIVNKARGILGFIKRWAKEFNDPYVTKRLYTSLVRPVLEYASVVWDPVYMTHINSIESVQKQFLLFCLRSLHWNLLDLPPYTSRLALIKLPTLKSRRTMLNVSFILNLINGDISSIYLLNNILLNVPTRPSRHYELLSIKYFTTNYANADPFRRMCSQFNKYYKVIDFSLSPNLIKSKIIILLNSL